MKKVAAYTYFYVRINKEVIYLKWLGETQKYKDDFIRDLRGLLAIPSLRNDAEKKEGAPFGNGPKEALDYMLRLGEREGFKTKNMEKGKRASVCWDIWISYLSEKDGPKILLREKLSMVICSAAERETIKDREWLDFML